MYLADSISPLALFRKTPDLKKNKIKFRTYLCFSGHIISAPIICLNNIIGQNYYHSSPFSLGN
jgi:hypothetical protein